MPRIPLAVLADLPAGLPAQRRRLPITSHYVNQVELAAPGHSGPRDNTVWPVRIKDLGVSDGNHDQRKRL